MSLNLKPIREQVIVITGASSGIGRAIAESLAVGGASVCLIGRKRTVLQALIDSLPDRPPNAVRAGPMDGRGNAPRGR